jgi:hypothetical protein
VCIKYGILNPSGTGVIGNIWGVLIYDKHLYFNELYKDVAI